VTLQDAWDRADVSTLRSMMTDGMVDEIRAQLADRASHTGGDTVVYLPDKRFVMVSDTIPVANPTPGIGFGGNGGSAVQVPGLLGLQLVVDDRLAISADLHHAAVAIPDGHAHRRGVRQPLDQARMASGSVPRSERDEEPRMQRRRLQALVEVGRVFPQSTGEVGPHQARRDGLARAAARTTRPDRTRVPGRLHRPVRRHRAAPAAG